LRVSIMVKRSFAVCLLAAALATGLMRSAAADPAPNETADEMIASAPGGGDAILRRAATANGALQSFTVPVHFDVSIHKFISLRVGVDGTNFFRAPDQEALIVTKTPPVIGGAFRGNYNNLVTLPQVWPGRYKVQSVKILQRDDQQLFELFARPRAADDVDHVVFDVTRNGCEPVAAEWFYRDGSTIKVTITNAPVGEYMLPSIETIVVSMPGNHFEATAHYGHYDLNAAVPRSIFTAEK
jgi:hypothetical protein